MYFIASSYKNIKGGQEVPDRSYQAVADVFARNARMVFSNNDVSSTPYPLILLDSFGVFWLR